MKILKLLVDETGLNGKPIEEWRPDPFNANIMVSTLGRCKRLSRLAKVTKYTPNQILPEKFLKTWLNGVGYPMVGFGGKNYRLHRILAETFIPNPYNKREVNHIDGDKSNYSLSNLEWATSSENRQHAWDTGLKISTIQRTICCLRTGIFYDSIKKASLAYNYSCKVMEAKIKGIRGHKIEFIII